MFEVKGYYNTGFDIINIPETPALLRTSATKVEVFPVLDILQMRFLPSIKIKLTNAQYQSSEEILEGLDYVELIDQRRNGKSVFYYVSGYSLTSADVAVLSVVQDSLLTSQALTNMGFAQSIFYKRCTIPRSYDKFGAWDLDDELLCPNEPLQLVHSGQTSPQPNSDFSVSHSGYAGFFFQFTHSNGRSGAQYRSFEHSIVLSSVGLTVNGGLLLSPINVDNYRVGNTYLPDGAGGWLTVGNSQYPAVYKTRDVNVYLPAMIKGRANLNDLEYRQGCEAGSVMIHYSGIEYDDLVRYDANGTVKEALDTLRELGLENGILACYSLPEGAGEITDYGGANAYQMLVGKSYIYSTNGWYTTGTSGHFIGERANENSVRRMLESEAFDYDYLCDQLYSGLSERQPHNMRILYGKFRKYVMSSPATGSVIEALPEELTGLRWSYDSQKKHKHGSPYICCFTDPRPTGRPYYNFLKFGMSQLDTAFNLYEGAIAGGQWSEVPVVFTGLSGEFQAKVGYQIDASYSDYLASPERTYRNMVSGAQMANYTQRHNTSSIDQSFVNQTMAGAAGGAIFGPEGAVIGGIGGAAKGALGYAFNDYNANMTYKVNLEAANRDMLRGSTGNYNEAMLGNVTANALIERKVARDYERAKFELATAYQVPRANFMSTDSMRDFTENCLFYGRYTPTIKDLERMDAILDAYGYKVNSFASYDSGLGIGRSRYCYIEGSVEASPKSSAVVGGKEMLADINSQLSNGVRIWKVKPDGVLNPGN